MFNSKSGIVNLLQCRFAIIINYIIIINCNIVKVYPFLLLYHIRFKVSLFNSDLLNINF